MKIYIIGAFIVLILIFLENKKKKKGNARKSVIHRRKKNSKYILNFSKNRLNRILIYEND